MGAIVAIMGEAGDRELPERLEKMLQRSAYRGSPERYFEHGLAIGIQTLGWDASLATSGNWTVAMHGFIGNWCELAPAHGFDFPDDADNATKLALAYERLGSEMFAKLRGEFAIVVYDRSERRLLAVRDVPGCRPLFSGSFDGRTSLATEIRQVLAGADSQPEADREGLLQEIFWVWPDRTRTHFRGVFRPLPGLATSIGGTRAEGTNNGVSFWQPPSEERGSYDFDALSAELGCLLDQAMDRWTPDRPFAVGMSDGVDSTTLWSLVTARARSGDTRSSMGSAYSLVFPEDDRGEIDIIEATHRELATEGVLVDGTGHHYLEHLADMAERVDGLYTGQLSALDLLAARVCCDGRHTLMLGIGGDEWLAGNLGHLADDLFFGRPLGFFADLFRFRLSPGTSRARFVARYTLFPLIRRLTSRLQAKRRQAWPRHGRVPTVESESDRIGLLDADRDISRSRRSLLNSLAYVQDSHEYDTWEQIVAQHHVELRHPFTDLDIIEFAFQTPGRAGTHGYRAKHLLRASVVDVLPPTVQRRNTKTLYPTFDRDDPKRLHVEMPLPDWQLARHRIIDVSDLEDLLSGAEEGRNEGQYLQSVAVAEALLRCLYCGDRTDMARFRERDR
jgi:asparagine synthetase B (glutamine-hydrolysing)